MLGIPSPTDSQDGMKDPLPILPFTRPVAGRVELPGSKSVTNRALLMAALCDHKVTLRNALFSEDTEIMARALTTLGFEVTAQPTENSVQIRGQGGKIPNPDARIFIGNAGTAARFLTAFLCLREGGSYYLDGENIMRNRPMKGLLDALNALGAEIQYEGQTGHFPFTLHTHGLSGGKIEVNASASSQFLSALLMAAPHAKDLLQISLRGETVSKPFVEMTHRMMEQFGLQRYVTGKNGGFEIEAPCNYNLEGAVYEIEPDATAASYFAILPLVTGGTISVRAFSEVPLQGDSRFLSLLRENTRLCVESDSSEISFRFEGGRRLPSGRDLLDLDFNPISDTFLTLAAVAPLFESRVHIRGIGHTRKQESDRLASVAHELRRLGQGIEEGVEDLLITPDLSALRERAARGVTIETYNDHRIAMSFAILGCANILDQDNPWLSIKNPDCVAKTFPRFFDILGSLHTES